MREYITSQLKTSGPYNVTGFFAALTRNLIDNIADYSNQNIFDYFVSGDSILQDPQLSALLDRDSIMGYHGVPSTPIYAYQAIGDETCHVANTDALIERYCAVGTNILFQRNTVGGHVAESINGALASLAFLKRSWMGHMPVRIRLRMHDPECHRGIGSFADVNGVWEIGVAAEAGGVYDAAGSSHNVQ